MAGFTFDTPKLPLTRLPERNPLLERATVVDRTSSGAAASTSGVAAEDGGGGVDDMGAALGKPVVLSRHQRVAPVRRKRVPFEIGHSPVDWVRLTKSGADLAGLEGAPLRRDITLEEVARHQTREDCWTVLRGKVYNLTPYLKFHPGGVAILMSVAGKDGTALFNKYHAWVNAEFMLVKCLVGYLAPHPSPAAASPAAVSAAASPSDRSTAGSEDGHLNDDEQQQQQSHTRQAVPEQLTSA